MVELGRAKKGDKKMEWRCKGKRKRRWKWKWKRVKRKHVNIKGF